MTLLRDVAYEVTRRAGRVLCGWVGHDDRVTVDGGPALPAIVVCDRCHREALQPAHRKEHDPWHQ